MPASLADKGIHKTRSSNLIFYRSGYGGGLISGAHIHFEFSLGVRGALFDRIPSRNKQKFTKRMVTLYRKGLWR